jgi:hypothetical protein
MIEYFLLSIVVFLGLVSGLIISHFAREELEAGKKYFVLLQRLLALIILGVFLYSFHVKIYMIIIALFILSTLIYQFKVALPVYYVVFGGLFFFSPERLNVSALMFLFGLPSGALVYKDKKSFLFSLLFFVPVIIFYAVQMLFFI